MKQPTRSSKFPLLKTHNTTRISPWTLDRSNQDLVTNNKVAKTVPIKDGRLASVAQLALVTFAVLISFGALALGVYSAVMVQDVLKTSTTTAMSFSYRWNISGTTIAGITGSPGHLSTQLYTPMRLALDSSNALYVAEWDGHRITKWPAGYLGGTIVAGQAGGVLGATANSLQKPFSIVLDENENYYIVDTGNHRILFWPSGAVQGSTIAGVAGVAANTNIHLYYPYNLARDPASGALYIADTYNNRVMRYFVGIASGDRIAGDSTAVAGTGATQLSTPIGIHYDAISNSLIIVNYGANNIVRWVIGATTWTLIAGSPIGTAGLSSTLLRSPVDIAVDSMGNLYVTDCGNHRVQFFRAGQSNGTTIAGMSTGTNPTQLSSPYGLLLDKDLNLYVADSGNHRIQKFIRNK